MREQFNQWDFVVAAYAIGIIGTVLIMLWALLSMRRAEQRRDAARSVRDDAE